ncbi:SIMPL domain-containing protein [Oceanospirillum sediminis]|uniref:SIMPL domain-containing protein n=1 Tax=Oceanospirillum sediminis TaxID=2760088 RepID=A0A839IQV5_9GAMM|nr:SIMPL domain-containing protein [Oceanospirillum sediminis]MBB1487044.1 SIMPL domain-containing protein [Oceanospirillum sediminis]
MNNYALLPLIYKAFLTIICLFLSTTLNAETRPEQPHLLVKASSEFKFAPDTAILTLTLDNTSPHLKKARDNVEKRSRKLLRSLLRFNLPQQDIEMGQLYIQPIQIQGSQRSQTRVSQTITLYVRSINRYPDILDRINSSQTVSDIIVKFEHSNEEVLKEQVLDEAINKAREKAERMASRLGQKTGRVFSIEESSQRYPDHARSEFRVTAPRNSSLTSTPEPDQIRLTSDVRVIFFLVP